MKKTKIKVAEFELHLGKDFERAIIHNPKVKNSYELIKTQHIYRGKTVYGLALKPLKN